MIWERLETQNRSEIGRKFRNELYTWFQLSKQLENAENSFLERNILLQNFDFPNVWFKSRDKLEIGIPDVLVAVGSPPFHGNLSTSSLKTDKEYIFMKTNGGGVL